VSTDLATAIPLFGLLLLVLLGMSLPRTRAAGLGMSDVLLLLVGFVVLVATYWLGRWLRP
jgi:hypothetical protein